MCVYQSGPRRLHSVNGAKSNNSRCGSVNIEEPRRDVCTFMDARRVRKSHHNFSFVLLFIFLKIIILHGALWEQFTESLQGTVHARDLQTRLNAVFVWKADKSTHFENACMHLRFVSHANEFYQSQHEWRGREKRTERKRRLFVHVSTFGCDEMTPSLHVGLLHFYPH